MDIVYDITLNMEKHPCHAFVLLQGIAFRFSLSQSPLLVPVAGPVAGRMIISTLKNFASL